MSGKNKRRKMRGQYREAMIVVIGFVVCMICVFLLIGGAEAISDKPLDAPRAITVELKRP